MKSSIPAANVLSILDKAQNEAGVKQRTYGSPDRGIVNIISESSPKRGVVRRKLEINQQTESEATGIIVPREVHQYISNIISQIIPLLSIGLLIWWEYVPEESRAELFQRFYSYEQLMKEINTQLDPVSSEPPIPYSAAVDELPERTPESMAVWIAGVTLAFALMIAATVIKNNSE